ncbi:MULTISPECIES: hypothetical protein [Malaciobacter]|jgi:hypothetical protein|uniref:Uncharacterized protein n=2 Tax=Malaciobacter TaxID=2321114 RepID=A0AB36ZXE0_9BACT|nr:MULTISPECIES: hypothetical protein [Malaciobacter]PHO10430.1 hypothetical protein CPG37_05100 [Malaciobacter canalis]PPK61934.1 hypothetical protein B0F89_10628 [Malaciobacter marinus]QEE32536.1 hypothetical protein ACAN_1047 [Malaciobacter canalis]SKB25670.1 hypothetical protein SAMN06295997_10226 [Malaciobacter marinus]
MSKYEDDELSMHKIEDYDGNESKSKRNTVRLVIALIIIVGAIYASFKYNYSQIDDDYVGTQENPGIDTSKR